jgi:hypothetical protein
MLDGTTKGSKQLGIYELKNGILKSAFAAPGAERPKDFSTKPGDMRSVTVWKRTEQAPAQPPAPAK